MNKELSKTLKDKYPEQYKHIRFIECGDGWYDLLESLSSTIQYHLNSKKEIKFFWLQLKEKFGGLRAYAEGADDYIFGAISMAEAMSYRICEYSGEKGKLRNKKKIENGQTIVAWMKTLSDKQAEKEDYVVE